MTVSLLPWMVLAAVTGDPAVVAAPPAGAPSESRSGEELFRRGVAAYDAREYASAVDWFKKAYAADAEPAILFNIAQAYRALGDCKTALDNVETFLKIVRAGDPLLARANGKKKELEACVAASGGGEKGPVTLREVRREASGTPPAINPETPLPSQSLQLAAAPSQPYRPHFFQGAMATTCAISVGGGLAFGLTSLGLNIASNSLADRVDGAMTWTPEVAADDAQSRAFGRASVITAIAAGGLALIAGASCGLRWGHLRSYDRAD